MIAGEFSATVYDPVLLESRLVSEVYDHEVCFVGDLDLDVHFGLGGRDGLVGLVGLHRLGVAALVVAQVVDRLRILLDREDVCQAILVDAEEDFASPLRDGVVACVKFRY